MNFIAYLNSGLPPTCLFNNPVSKQCYIPHFFKQFPPHGWTNSFCTAGHFLLPVNGPEPCKNIWHRFAKHYKVWGVKRPATTSTALKVLWLFSSFLFFIPYFRPHPQTLHPCLPDLLNPNLLCFNRFQRAKTRIMHWNSPPVGQHHCTTVSHPANLSGEKRQMLQGLLLKQLCPSFQLLLSTTSLAWPLGGLLEKETQQIWKRKSFLPVCKKFF